MKVKWEPALSNAGILRDKKVKSLTHAQWLDALAAVFAKDPGWIPSTQMMAHNHLNWKGSDTLF